MPSGMLSPTSYEPRPGAKILQISNARLPTNCVIKSSCWPSAVEKSALDQLTTMINQYQDKIKELSSIKMQIMK